PCGTSVTTFAADGTVHDVFDIHDNGRGPHSDITLKLAPDGTIASFEAHGHSTFGAPSDETFALTGGRAKWDSQDEHGDQAVSGPVFFEPLSAADTDPFLIAALQAHGGTLQLLPGGTVKMEKAGDATIQLNGASKHLIAYALTGIALTPNYVWTEDDGTFFAEGDNWSWLGPEGAEAAQAQLVAKQQELTRAHDKDVAAKLGHKAPAAGVALTHAKVLDVEHGKWLTNQTLLIRGDRIAALGASIKIPKGAEIIDLQGKAVLPGLWDMHSHLGDADGVLDVASGITSARDVGNKPDVLDDYKKRYDDGSAVGPHVYRAGFIEGRGKDAAHSEITAMTEAEAKAAVEFYAKRGYEQIKIYNSMPVELVPILAREAHAHGMGVTGHIPAHMLANEAVSAGYDGIEHQNQVLLNFFATHETDTRTLQRFSLVGDELAGFDLNSKKAKDFFGFLREHHTVVDPTVATFELTYVAGQGKLPPGTEKAVARLPVQVQRGYFTGGLSLEGKADLYKRSFDKMLQSLKSMQDAKVIIVTGTDGIAGITLQRELELFVKGGLSPIDAIRDATIVPARAMKVDVKTGSIAKGKVADLLVVDGDPLANISDISKSVMTFEAGVRYPSKELYETVGVAPW
ncbi:MAG TPA: amidohydrolase family protein, partial [Myxococcales bacterium]|nr:amidohydrolase family protein [Myxococcales bacterium]